MSADVAIGTATRLVGRVRELGVLDAAIGRAAAGSVQVVAISGETGIGKSRLAREGLRAAAEKGFRILESAAGWLDRDLSYAPMVEALRPLVAEPALTEGLSDLARLFEGLRVPPLVALGDPGLERTRMFEAVRKLVDRASSRVPLAVFIDDLHWADSGTLALLHYVVRGLKQRRCMFFVTYRADEAGGELHELLVGLQRAAVLTPIALGGLDSGEVEDLAAAMLKSPAPSALRGMLGRRSNGVPLYIKAIVLQLIETGTLFRSGGAWVLGPGVAAEVPAVMSTLLRDKIAVLPPNALQVLNVLAVCGGAAEHVLVAHVADDVVVGVSELRAADVIVEDTTMGSLSYRIVHPVLAEVAYDMVPVVVRQQLHVRLARAVEEHRPDDVRLLAVHVRAAGEQVDPDHALEVLTAATRADLARLAGEEACANAAAGLNLARRLGRRKAVDELAGAYAEACELAGRMEGASSAWLEAADSAADPRMRARRLTRGASVAWDLGRFADGHRLLDAADRALAGQMSCLETLDVEEFRVRFAGRAGDAAGLKASISRLETLERAIGSSRARAVLLVARMMLTRQTGRYGDVLGVADEVVSCAGELESPLEAEALLRPVVAARIAWGDLVGARATAEEGLRLARVTGVPALEIIHSSLLVVIDMLAGNWQAALRRTHDDLELSERVGLARGVLFALGTQAMVLVRLGDLDEAADRVSEAHRLFGEWSAADRHAFAWVDLAEAMVAMARNEFGHALEIAAGEGAYHSSLPPLALAILGEAQATAGDATGARNSAARLAALGPGAPYPAALAAWISALAAGARRDPPQAFDALPDLDQAIAGFAELGMPYEEGVARLDRAQVQHAAGYQSDRIAGEVTADLEIFDRLRAKLMADRARAVLRDLGHRPAAVPSDRNRRRLSGREEEVARLVAQGLSNAEIGQRLFISSRTVATHLHHIYRRLGLHSRAALIKYVLEGSPAPEVTSRGGLDT
jgi:DNA-binding CsgD family transcriptional regulator/tetratricopeptide (TPR) repeat protein